MSIECPISACYILQCTLHESPDGTNCTRQWATATLISLELVDDQSPTLTMSHRWTASSSVHLLQLSALFRRTGIQTSGSLDACLGLQVQQHHFARQNNWLMTNTGTFILDQTLATSTCRWNLLNFQSRQVATVSTRHCSINAHWWPKWFSIVFQICNRLLHCIDVLINVLIDLIDLVIPTSSSATSTFHILRIEPILVFRATSTTSNSWLWPSQNLGQAPSIEYVRFVSVPDRFPSNETWNRQLFVFK